MRKGFLRYDVVYDFAPIPLNFLIYKEIFFFFISALLKILTSDPRNQPGILGCHWLTSFWPVRLLEFQNFLESSAPDPRKKLRQNYSRPRTVLSFYSRIPGWCGGSLINISTVYRKLNHDSRLGWVLLRVTFEQGQIVLWAGVVYNSWIMTD